MWASLRCQVDVKPCAGHECRSSGVSCGVVVGFAGSCGDSYRGLLVALVVRAYVV